MTNSNALPQAAAAELLARRRARESILAFTQYTMSTYEVNWHHQIVCEYLDRFVAGDIKRLMVFMPPRSGKSELVSRRLPAYVLGRNPDETVIAASYGDDLAKRMNRDVQRIVDNEPYKALFPNTRLSGANVRTVAQGTWLRNSDIFEVVGRGGYYRSAGVGGAITGMGMSVGIVDDPIKNRKEADSLTYRQGVWDWYTSTFYTRLAPGGRILLTVTRWHEDDLAGRLLNLAQSEPGADQWTVINLPAMSEEPIPPYDPRPLGTPLWPDRWDESDLDLMRLTIGSRDWNALYQQRPAPDEGGIFKKRWWRYWQPWGADLPPVPVKVENGDFIQVPAEKVPRTFDDMVQSWDCAFKDTATSDYVAGQTWGRLGANKYLLDYRLDRLDVTGTMRAIEDMTAKYPKTHTKLIEDKANGPAVIQMLKGKVTGLIAVEPEGGKVSRAYAAAPEVEAGNVYLPHPMIAPWVERFIASCGAFPNAAHDDDVDAFTQAIIRWQQMRQGRRARVGEY